jgi:toluene monooxygenase system protein A
MAAVIGNLRAARFGRDGAWRSTALLGALDELRHAQIPLLLMHDLVRWDRQFDFTHRLLHTDDWVAIAARHLLDEMLLASNPIEMAIATNFVFETGFTNLQFIGLSAVAHRAGDRMFEKMVQSIQTDEARHAQIGRPVLEVVLRHDPAYAQYLVDKWFWRSWQFFAVVTGFAMDYLAPLSAREGSFRDFTQEWILEQFQRSLEDLGLKRPWYWSQFLESMETYHHMVYASAYSYRATVWFDLVLPGPEERAWLRDRYPRTWPMFDPLWDQITDRCRSGGPDVEWRSHGTVPVGFCHLCQLVLCGGTPEQNSARVVEHDGRRRIFCSEPCQWIYEQEPARYRQHQDVVERILGGQMPGNLLALTRESFGLDAETQGKDAHRGRYPWLLPLPMKGRA